MLDFLLTLLGEAATAAVVLTIAYVFCGWRLLTDYEWRLVRERRARLGIR